MKAAIGNERALVQVASRLELGIGIPADPARAMALFCRAALLGNRGAILHIADWLLVDDTPDYDPTLAAHWIHRLQRAELGLAPVGPQPRCPSAAPSGLPAMAGALRQMIERLAPRYGLSADLVKAVVEVESSYQVNAVSPAGARGLMQLMPASASAVSVSDSMDADANLRGGMETLARLITRYHTLPLALAAYNAGEGAVDACGCVPAIPETVHYVARVLALYHRSTSRTARTLVYGDAAAAKRERAATLERIDAQNTRQTCRGMVSQTATKETTECPSS